VTTGRTYLLRGQRVTVLIAWSAKRHPEHTTAPPWLRLNTRPTAPRNVLIRYPDGTITIRPMRRLRRPPDTPAP
jgi:hypothetical protein